MSSKNKKKIQPPQDLAETTMDGQVLVYSESVPWSTEAWGSLVVKELCY
jgi:hypothetical protein